VLKEIRWHGRAGQGAKTASNVLALALLRSGRHVQSFPEYGPERRGAPMRAYTRLSDAPIERHDSVVEPDLVAVLDRSLLADPAVEEGLRPDGLVLVNPEGQQNANLRVAGLVAAALGEPTLDELQRAALDVLGAKAASGTALAAIEEGYRWKS
jgi:pyruvate ferredoxin oxidoreductase gamma subunit